MKTSKASQSKKDLFGSNINKEIVHGTVDDLRHKRIKRGECPTCQRKTHKVKISRFRSKRVPLTVEGEVVNGICLRCNPLTKDASPSTSASVKSAPVREVPDTFVCDDDFTVASEITLDSCIEQQVPRRSNRYNSKPFESVSEETPMTNFRRDDDQVTTDIVGSRQGRRDRGRGQPSMPRVVDDEDDDEEDDTKWIATQRRQQFHPMSREMYLFTSERSLGVESTGTGVESNDGSENSTEHFGPPKNLHPFSRELYRLPSERSLLSNSESIQSSEHNNMQRQASDKSLTLEEVIQNERVHTNNRRMLSMKRESSTTSMSAVSSDSGYSSDGQKIKSMWQGSISSGKKEKKVQTQAGIDDAVQKSDHSYTPAPMESERKPKQRRPSRFSLRHSLNLKDLPLERRRASDPSYDFETELDNSRNWNSVDILRDAAAEANGEKLNLQDFRKEMEAELMAKRSEKEPVVHSSLNEATKETPTTTDELSSTKSSLSYPPSNVVRLGLNLKNRPPLRRRASVSTCDVEMERLNLRKETPSSTDEPSSMKSSSRFGLNLKDRPPRRRRVTVSTCDVEMERQNSRNWSSLDILRDAAAEANGEEVNVHNVRKEMEAELMAKRSEKEPVVHSSPNDAMKETITKTDELSSTKSSLSYPPSNVIRLGLNLKNRPPLRRRASVSTCDVEMERLNSRNWSSLDILRDAAAEANGEEIDLQDFRKEMEAELMAKGNKRKPVVHSLLNEATKETPSSTDEPSLKSPPRLGLNSKDRPPRRRRVTVSTCDIEMERQNSMNWSSLDILRDAAAEANGEEIDLQDFRKEMEVELMAKRSEKEPVVHSSPNDAMKQTPSSTDEPSSTKSSLSYPPSKVVRLGLNLKNRPPLRRRASVSTCDVEMERLNLRKETNTSTDEPSSMKSSSRFGLNLKDRPPRRRRVTVSTCDVEMERQNSMNWSSLDILRDAAAEANGEEIDLQDFRKEMEAELMAKRSEKEPVVHSSLNEATKETPSSTDEPSSMKSPSRFGLNSKDRPPRRRRVTVSTCDVEMERLNSRNWSSLDILRDAAAEANGEEIDLQDFRKEMEAELMAKGDKRKPVVHSLLNEATKETPSSTDEPSSMKSSLPSPLSAVVAARTTNQSALTGLSAGDIICALQGYSSTESSACCAFFEEACARLADLTLISDNHTHLVELGVVQTLCDALHKHSSSIEVSLNCCAALANLSASSSTRDIMFGHGVIDHLFACIKAEFDCPEVDREAFRSLVSLSDSSSEAKQIISCDLDTIIAAFYLHETDRYIQVATCSILQRLSVDVICRTMIMAFPEIFDVLGSIIQANPNKKTVEMDACSLLRNLSLEEDGDFTLRFVPFVMITMAANVGSREIFENACFFLSTVGLKQPKAFGALCTEDGIKCIIHTLQNNDTSLSLLEACCLALRAAINDSDEHKKLCLSTGAIDAIICLIMVHPHETSLLEAALTVLVSISSKKKCVAAIANAGGIGCVATSMRSNPTSSGIIRNGSRFIKNVVKADPYFANEAVPAVVSILSCIKEQVHDQVLIEELCKSLHYLVLKSENWADRIISADGIAVIETAMKHNDKNRRIVKQCDVLLQILYNIT